MIAIKEPVAVYGSQHPSNPLWFCLRPWPELMVWPESVCVSLELFGGAAGEKSSYKQSIKTIGRDLDLFSDVMSDTQ